MLAEERRRTIMGMLRRSGSVRTTDLAVHFGVSDQTIRRDLMDLERLGILQKTYGGGVLANYRGTAYEQREELNRSAKLAIAAEAASLVRPGMTVAIAPGTTNAAIADQLNGLSITIVTNNISVLEHVKHPNTRVIVTGGEYRAGAKALVGELTESGFATCFADIGFVGVSGVDLDRGLTVTDSLEALALRQVIRVSKRAVVALDSAKFHRTAAEVVAPLGAVHTLITDELVAREAIDVLTSNGVETIIATLPDREATE